MHCSHVHVHFALADGMLTSIWAMSTCTYMIRMNRKGLVTWECPSMGQGFVERPLMTEVEAPGLRLKAPIGS